MRTIIILFFVIVFDAQVFAQKDSKNYTILPFKQALKENKMKVAISGSYNPQKYYPSGDADGIHYGKCMDVILESELDTFVVLKLDAGYSLIPNDSHYQTMFVTKTIELPLFPKSRVPFQIYAMCGEIHEEAPNYSIKYTLGETADSTLLTTIKIIEMEYLQNIIGQYMVWAVANQASKMEIVNSGGDSLSLNKAISYLSNNNIDCKLVRENRKPPLIATNKKPAFVNISKYLLYAGLTYSIIISFGLIFISIHLYRKNVKVNT